ncbi:hypothetical protein FGRMN_10385 [Fusarium graminum]|nr:hypothetical protein FGRMN_10385 [Fusarium graminum]
MVGLHIYSVNSRVDKANHNSEQVPPPSDLGECQKLLREAHLSIARLEGVKETILAQTKDLKNELEEARDENNQLRLQAALAQNAQAESEKTLKEIVNNQQKRQVEMEEEPITQNSDLHRPKRQKQDVQQQTPQPPNDIECAEGINTSDQGNGTKGPRDIGRQENAQAQSRVLELVEAFLPDNDDFVFLSVQCSQERVYDDISSGNNQAQEQQNRANLESFASHDTRGRWFCLRDVQERGIQATGYTYHPTCKIHEGECRFAIRRERNLFLPKISVKYFGRKTTNPI